MLKIPLEEYDDLEEDFEFSIEIIEDISCRLQTSYNREIEYDAIPMGISNREEW